MKYGLSDDTWGPEEINALQEVIDSRQFSMSAKVKRFENDFCNKFDVKYSVMVSSGSAANLLMIAALVYSKRLNAGDEVIVTAVSWSTTYFPLMQFGLKIRFVDINRETLNIDTTKIEQAITDKTKMIFLVNLLGNPNEFQVINDICKKHNLFMIEDNCESLGAVYKNRQLGTIGLIGTYSTFYSHHLCTMEGGIAVTNNEELYHYMLSIRAHGWTRNLPSDSKIYKKKDDPFYESFNFIIPGFNLRPLEMEAAVGIEQLKKMDKIIIQRRNNAEYFIDKARVVQGIITQKEIEKSSWFGFSVLFDKPFDGMRNKAVRYLSEAGIEVRPIVAGNFTRNHVIKYFDYSIYDKLINADDIHENGFFIGNHSKDIRSEIDYFFIKLAEVLNKK